MFFVKLEYLNINDDILLMYFISGIIGEFKMVVYDFIYLLGYIVIGSFWYNLKENSFYFIIVDIGWGKVVWGKFYG